jgi:plasmid stabilization system protein ParE
MEVKEIFWNQKPIDNLKLIYEYYLGRANKSIADKITEGIVHETIRLENNPKIGQKEELLLNYPQEYRYIVHGNYKIIYFENHPKNRIDIVNVFDTRQNPTKMEEF